MFLAGHTLGTPHMTVPEALRLFADVGLTGAEVIYQNGYLSGLPEGDLAEAERVRAAADAVGIRIVALTPYVTGINSVDDEERARDVARLKASVDSANVVGANRIRIYAGSWTDAPTATGPNWQSLVESLREIGDYASSRGVIACVENHFNTMTVSAEWTARLCREVDSPGVGAIYDQANLTFSHCESPDVAIALQAPWIRHVHVKDLVFTDPSRPFVASETFQVAENERAIRSRVVGDGILDWVSITKELDRIGYDGALSFEYEYRWHAQDLPDPAIGLRRSVELLGPVLEQLEAERSSIRATGAIAAQEERS